MKKRLLSVLLTLCLLLSLVPMTATAETEVPEGLSYEITDEGTITIDYLDPENEGELIIPDTIEGYPVTALECNAFSACTGLTSVYIPASVTAINSNAFSDCISLERFEVDPDNTSYCSKDGVLFNKDMNVLVTFPAGKSGDYTIPSGVIVINSYAFEKCTGLTSVTIPESVTTIRNVAFWNCDSSTVIYYDGTKTQWDKISIGPTNPFLNETEIHFNSEETPTPDDPTPDDPVEPVTDPLFYTITDEGTITITGLNADYKGKLEIPDEIDGHPVTAIADYAFSNSIGLTDTVIPESVTDIGNGAFYNCTGLTSVEIPESVTSIACKAFCNCSSLTSVKIPDSVTSVEEYAFSDCSSLTSVVIPDSVTSIGSRAFSACDALTTVTIPDGITEIKDYTFYNSGLASIEIPASVTSIGSCAFSACIDLRDVYFSGSEEEWNQITIVGDNYMLTAAEFHFAVNMDVTHRFTDVISGMWYVPYIQTAVDNKFMSGTSATTFDPNGSATRAMFVQILYAMAGKPDVTGLTCPFTDVPAGEWYYNAVTWAYNNNVTSGTSVTTFGTNDSITREQIALLLYAYTGKPEVSGELTGFTDTASVDSWAYTGLLWAKQQSIIKGSSEGNQLLLNPQKGASRAEIATMMTAFYKIKDTEPVPDDSAADFSNVQVGDYITFGSYEQDNDLTNGAESIEWRVLAVEDGKALVISKYGLDNRCYNDVYNTITWGTCGLRTWLNNDFISIAFTAEERSRILTTNVQNPDTYDGYYDWMDPETGAFNSTWVVTNDRNHVTNVDYVGIGGNPTADQLFLLNIDEARDLFDSTEKTLLDDDGNEYTEYSDLECAPTAYAIAQGAYVSDDLTTEDGEATCWWWLRSTAYVDGTAYGVNFNGCPTESNYAFNSGVIRPAMWITLT